MGDKIPRWKTYDVLACAGSIQKRMIIVREDREVGRLIRWKEYEDVANRELEMLEELWKKVSKDLQEMRSEKYG
jgi:hypothetical protein